MGRKDEQAQENIPGERLAAQRAIIIRQTPRLDGSGFWDIEPELPEGMSPFEAHGVMLAAIEELGHLMWDWDDHGD